MGQIESRTVLRRQVQALRARLAELERVDVAARKRAEIEHALRERVKELELMYAISDLRELHASSIDRFLQGVVDCLPRAWQYPSHAHARIVLGERRFSSAKFRKGPWQMHADVRERGERVGAVEVHYRSGVPAAPGEAFLKEEHALLRVVAERVSTALLQMKSDAELRDAHKLLRSQHLALEETNIALRTVLSRLEEEKREIRTGMMVNIQKIIMPIIFELELAVTGVPRSYVTLLRQSLQEIASPFLAELSRDHQALAPVELAIATMIRNGLSTKEIARLRGIAPGTVRRHRENIRRKLGLTNRKANLVTFLQSRPSNPGTKSIGDHA